MITTSVTNTYKFVGLSTETKPKGPAVGSIFEETDTGDTFFYNGKRWVKLAEEESGGGALCVTFTVDDSGDDPVWSADKTFAEIAAAVENGQYVYGMIGNAFLNCAVFSDEDGAAFTGMDVTDSVVGIASITIDNIDDTVSSSYNLYDLSSLIVE